MKDKLEAVYELRYAAEAHGRAEAALEIDNTAENREAVLDAKVDLEAKTAEAIEACHSCEHQEESERPIVRKTPEGVIEIHFRRKEPPDHPAVDGGESP